ncbi:MAG: c-type cytochrome [Verrucomicrobiales bacterium]|nr:c-type cytochrome [Verrucomicrobiales bacterium]
MALLLVCLGTTAISKAGAEDGATPASNAALEALQRLKGLDLEANPTLKEAVMRVVDGTRGTAVFVELVRDFQIQGQDPGLLDVAAKIPETAAASEALRLILAREDGKEVVGKAVQDADAPRRMALLSALASTSDPKAVPLLTRVLGAPTSTTAQRALAVRGLAGTEAGANALLTLGRQGSLDDTARQTAGLLLAQSRWPEVRTAAATVLPPPTGGDGRPLPAISDLILRRGDAARGQAVFRSEQAACIKCHRVGGEGVDYGPALTQIGTKLGKQALYESIIDPSAGIAFGFEGWSIETRAGDEVFGLLASETPTELAIKQQSGVVLRLPLTEVANRRQQQLSVMPAGLAQLLSVEDLVHLVEYLTTLQAPPGGPTP